MIELATYIAQQFSKCKGAELLLDLRGLPSAVESAKIWLFPSTVYDGNTSEVLITCESGGTILITPDSSVTEWTFVGKGFSLPVSQILSRMIQSFIQLSAYAELPASDTQLTPNQVNRLT